MKKSIVTLLVLACILAVTGCSTMLGENPCADVEPSVLCDMASKTGMDLVFSSDLIMVLNLKAVQDGKYSAQEAAEVFADIKYAASQEVRAIDLKTLAMSHIKEHPELLLVSRYLPLLDSPQYLTEKDKSMILGWCDMNLELLR